LTQKRGSPRWGAGFRLVAIRTVDQPRSVVREQNAVVLIVRRTAIDGTAVAEELVRTRSAAPEDHVPLGAAERVLLELDVAITIQHVLAILVVVVAVALLHIAG